MGAEGEGEEEGEEEGEGCNDYNKETYVICFWMYVSDWSALFYPVEAVQQAPGHPTPPGLHSLGVCAGVQSHTAHGGTHQEALQPTWI